MYTRRQIEYLAFISQYSSLMGIAPSEVDLAAYFEVTGPSAHQMVVTLERKGAIKRIPETARSIRVLTPPDTLPTIGWQKSRHHQPKNRNPTEVDAVIEFADFLAARICSRMTAPILVIGPLRSLAARVAARLQALKAPDSTIVQVIENLLSLPWRLERRRGRK